LLGHRQVGGVLVCGVECGGEVPRVAPGAGELGGGECDKVGRVGVGVGA
jgi:hypothetical protein